MAVGEERTGFGSELTPVIFELCYEVGDGELEPEAEGWDQLTNLLAGYHFFLVTYYLFPSNNVHLFIVSRAGTCTDCNSIEQKSPVFCFVVHLYYSHSFEFAD
jgi:hypothetical protein